jgi:hypothetical protein
MKSEIFNSFHFRGVMLLCLFTISNNIILQAQMPYSRPVCASHNDLDFTQNRASVAYGSAFRGMGIGFNTSILAQKSRHLIAEGGVAGGWDSAFLNDHHWKMGYIGVGYAGSSNFGSFNLELQGGLGLMHNRIYSRDVDDFFYKYRTSHMYGWIQMYLNRTIKVADIGAGFRVSGFFNLNWYGGVTGNDALEAVNKLKNLSGNAQVEPFAFINFALTEDRGTLLGFQVAGNLYRQNTGFRGSSSLVFGHVSLGYAF